MTAWPFFSVVGLETVPSWLLAPFGLLLLMIAIMPLAPSAAHQWWERNYPYVSVGLAALVGGYYLLRVPAGSVALGHSLHEYVSFIALIGSLFVVAGGIHLRVKTGTTPLENVALLLAGAVLANVIGTTGASVVLIRPWLRMNRARIQAYHIVFFIFIVSNVGGALTPIGDPPLFLGYLRGVPFFWLVTHLWAQWLVTLSLILAVFFVFDRWNFQAKSERAVGEMEGAQDAFKLEGLPNLALLAVIVGGVFLPERFFIREGVMLGAAVISLFTTPQAIHARNQFNFGPMREVAFLFIGIFTTMMPALNYLEAHGSELGVKRPMQYYYATGGLSAVLDNAPTYVNFLKLAETTFVEESAIERGDESSSRDRWAIGILLRDHPPIVAAISLAAVFFGAMTYIGNGPNFMVKSIAQSAGVKCPGFFGYIFKYSLPILLPILALSGWLFL